MEKTAMLKVAFDLGSALAAAQAGLMGNPTESEIQRAQLLSLIPSLGMAAAAGAPEGHKMKAWLGNVGGTALGGLGGGVAGGVSGAALAKLLSKSSPNAALISALAGGPLGTMIGAPVGGYMGTGEALGKK